MEFNKQTILEREDMNNLLDRLHQKILNNDSLMKKVTESELLALVEAKEKQIPMKPYIDEQDYGKAYVCTICETFIHYVDDEEEHLRFDYCPSCGQKLDW